MQHCSSRYVKLDAAVFALTNEVSLPTETQFFGIGDIVFDALKVDLEKDGSTKLNNPTA